jgi:hypothetical protein
VTRDAASREDPRHESAPGERPLRGDVLIAQEPGDGSAAVAISVVPGGPQFRVESQGAALQLLQPFAKRIGVDVWMLGDGSRPTRVVAGRPSRDVRK